MARRSDPTPHINAINHFMTALGELLDVSQRDSYSDTIVAKPGQAADWQNRRFAVDRLAPAAARAFIEAGVGVEWKPPGTWSTYPVNPAVEWATILSDFPKFGIDVLLATCHQALGSLESHAYEVPVRPRARPPHHIFGIIRRHAGVFIVTVAATILGGVVVAWAAFQFGWVG